MVKLINTECDSENAAGDAGWRPGQKRRIHRQLVIASDLDPRAVLKTNDAATVAAFDTNSKIFSRQIIFHRLHTRLDERGRRLVEKFPVSNCAAGTGRTVRWAEPPTQCSARRAANETSRLSGISLRAQR